MDTKCVSNHIPNDVLYNHLIISIANHQGVITYASDLFCEICQYSRDELIGKTHKLVNSSYHSNDLYYKLWNTISRGEVWNGKLRNKAKDGSFFWVDNTIVPYFNSDTEQYYYVSIAKDISKEKEYEILIEQSKQMFIEGPTMIFQWGLEDNWPVDYVTENVKQLGYTKQQLENKDIKFSEIIYHEDLDRVRKEANCFIKLGYGSFEQDYRVVTSDGQVRWVYDYTKVNRNKNGEVCFYYGYLIDVTDRVLVEKRLKNTLKKLSDIKYALDKSSILSITDSVGKFSYINKKFSEICQYKKSELIGTHYSIINSGNHGEQFYNDLYKTIQDGNIWEGEVEHKAKDGSLFWLYTTIIPFIDENNEPFQYVSIQFDVSERKKSEEVIKRMDKLTVIGELAAGIAHEIRNPLTSIKGFTKLIKQDLNNKNTKFIDIVEDEIERINFIVSEFMALAKPHMTEQKEHNIIALIHTTISLLESEALKEGKQIITNIPYDEIIITCEENQIKQVFVNIIKNAVEAMSIGGKVTIETKLNQGYIEIAFKDEGPGIPKEVLSKIGEPFFTTKEDGNGLGLMVSYKIIQDHGGKINVASEMNKGTKFIVSLPCKI